MTSIAVFEFATLALGVALLIWLVVTNDHFEALVLGFAVLLGLAMELTGVTQFHFHYYSADFLFVLGSDPEAVPIVIGVGWALVFFTTRRLADRLVTPWFLLPSVAGFLALTLDFFLDPMMARSQVPPNQDFSTLECVNALVPGEGFGIGAWVWCLPAVFNGQPIEQYLGVPHANYLAWFLIVAGYSFVLETVVRWYNVPAMSRWRQALMLLLAIIVTYFLVNTVLFLFQLLAGVGIRNLWILIFFAGLGILGIVLSGLNRTSWGFDWKCIALLALDTAICWYGFLNGEFRTDPGSEIIWRLALTNLIAFAVAFWIMMPPLWQPALNQIGPPLFEPLENPLTAARIQQALNTADQPADTVMAALYNAGANGIAEVNELMKELRDNSHDPDIINALPPDLANFFATNMVVDATVDQARLRRGQELFIRYSGLGIAALNIASLAESYALQGSNRVLGRTNRLKKPHAFKRIAETAQFVVYVMMQKGVQTPAGGGIGKGIIATLRVRLMHASIRWLIINGSPQVLDTDTPDYEHMPWDFVEHGQPVNQMEMAFTLLTFCWVTLRAMHDAGLNFTMDEADDYVYLWAVIGKYLGVEEDLRPQSANHAAGMFEQLKGLYRLEVEDEMAKDLNESALWVMSRMLYRRANLGSTLNTSIPRIYQTELIDADTRKVLGLDRLSLFEELILQPLAKLLFVLMARLDLLNPGGLGTAFRIRIGELLLLYFATNHAEVGTDLFEIPVELQPPP